MSGDGVLQGRVCTLLTRTCPVLQCPCRYACTLSCHRLALVSCQPSQELQEAKIEIHAAS